ncbi:response regulator [Paenibacillus solani]|uniref:response regulator n=1 Tax=Paenibacillus solani TaxID=1705565 RepID=UPI003D288F79
MYKVLLVDDEADVREGLALEIQWEACGFMIEGTAENGREAMELAERLEPDVVITDISMPFQDGLQLASWLREHQPLCKIVILTGYDEFDYARQAITLSVDEYLLKPFSAEHFMELLRKIKDKIDMEVAEREDVRLLKEHYRTSLPLLRESFLASLLTRKMPWSIIEEKTRNYGLLLNGGCYLTAVMALYPAAQDKEKTSSSSLRHSGDLDLMLHAMLNIAKEVVDLQYFGSAFIYQDSIVLLMTNDGCDDEAWFSNLQVMLDRLLKSILHYLKLSVTIGVGSKVRTLSNLKQSYQDALLALDYRLILGAEKVIFIDDVESPRKEGLQLDELKEQALIRNLKLGTAEELNDAISNIFDELNGASYTIQEVQVYVLEVVTAVLRTAKASGIEMEELFGAGFQLHAAIFKFSTLQEAEIWLQDISLTIRKHISSSRQHAYKDIVEKALQYTREHYGDPDISLQKVCMQLHISTGYFSGVFKRELKMTYVHYLLLLRMETAKELLRSTDLKAFEIAERVGYADPNYFSFCFKKQVGVSPKEYRSQARG